MCLFEDGNSCYWRRAQLFKHCLGYSIHVVLHVLNELHQITVLLYLQVSKMTERAPIGTRHQCQETVPSLEGACRNTTTTLTRAEIVPFQPYCSIQHQDNCAQRLGLSILTSPRRRISFHRFYIVSLVPDRSMTWRLRATYFVCCRPA
jgi:hypothetical protein